MGRVRRAPRSSPMKLQNLGTSPAGKPPGRHGALAPHARGARIRRRGRVVGLASGLLGAAIAAVAGGTAPQGVCRRIVPLGCALLPAGVVLVLGLCAGLVLLGISSGLALGALAPPSLASALRPLGTRASSTPLVTVRLPPPIIPRSRPAMPGLVVAVGRFLILKARLPLITRLLRVPASGPPPALLIALTLLAGPRPVTPGGG